MQLRPYQNDTLEKVRTGWTDFQRQLVVWPTGAGKTILAANVAKEFLEAGKRVLFLAHREELLTQTLEKFQRAAGIFAQLEKAEHKASLSTQCVVGSVQTFTARWHRWPTNHFDAVIVDEAHHIMAASYQKALAPFPNAKVMGITATPNRSDKKNLLSFFENVADSISLFELINAGYLSRIVIRSFPLNINVSGVKQSKGDYDSNALGTTLEPYLGAIAKEIRENAMFRRVLVFCPLIATSKKFVEACRAEGINAAHVDGTSDDRKEIAARFAAGEFELVSNAMLWTEGFDDPGIDCILNLRLTRSLSLYQQIVGRGTRVAPQKHNLLLLDPLWQHGKFDIMRPAHMVAPTEEIAEEITKKAEAASAGGGQQDLDLEGLASEAQGDREEKLRKELEEKSKRKGKTIDASAFAMSLGEQLNSEYERTAKWEFMPVSPQQAQALQKNGVDVDSVVDRGHASKLLDLIISRQKLNLATPGQVKYLKVLHHPNPELATFDEASEFIGRHKQHRRELAA